MEQPNVLTVTEDARENARLLLETKAALGRLQRRVYLLAREMPEEDPEEIHSTMMDLVFTIEQLQIPILDSPAYKALPPMTLPEVLHEISTGLSEIAASDFLRRHWRSR